MQYASIHQPLSMSLHASRGCSKVNITGSPTGKFNDKVIDNSPGYVSSNDPPHHGLSVTGRSYKSSTHRLHRQ
jgi:hypothetical protein